MITSDYKRHVTEESFSICEDGDSYRNTIINCEGSWSDYSRKYDINYSSILTKLIQEAGRWCESFASDLFIDWTEIAKLLKEEGFGRRTYLFGFRQSGVDGMSYVLNKMNNDYFGALTEYRTLWILEIHTEKSNYGTDYVYMKLERLH